MDPAVLVKLALVLAWRGLPSMRETLRVAGTDVSIRRFLGFGLTERLPDHSTFSHAQTKRFADSSVFEQLFTAVLRQCTEAGLVGGRRLLVDATHIEADAALKSLRAELAAGSTATTATATATARATASGALRGRVASVRRWRWPSRGRDRRRSARRLTRRRCRAAIRTPSCVTSPGIARIWCIAARSPSIPKARVIVAVEAERATGSEADALATLDRARAVRRPHGRELAADAGYASQDAYATLDALDDDGADPAAARRQAPGRRGRAAQRMRTPTGRDAAFDRQAHAEGAISELKRHGADRARCRGTRLLQLQLLAAATAINLKRLLSRHDAAAATARPATRATGWHDPLPLRPARPPALTRSTASARPIVQRAPRPR